MWEADDKVAYFLRNITPATVQEARYHSGLPSGHFPCVKYQITDPAVITDLFWGTGIDFVLVKYFATSAQDPSTFERLDIPLPLDGTVARDQSTEYLSWLVLEEQQPLSRHHALILTWWPSLLAQSQTGKLQVQFSYASIQNGVVLQGSLPVRPTAPSGLETHLNSYQVVPPTPAPVKLKLRIRLRDDQFEVVPQEPSLKIRVKKILY